MSQKRPFPVDPVLTSIAMAYENGMMIADSVLPRVPVGGETFKYTKFVKEDRFTIPETRVGRKSRVNEVEFGATEDEASVEDFGLEDPIPQSDINAAGTRFNPVNMATEGLSELILLDREKRVADLVMDAAQYSADHKQALGTPWTDPSTAPIEDILAALDAPLMRPNVMAFSHSDYRALSTHPDIVKAIHGNSGDSGIATRAQIAALFELEEILVGQSYLNTSKKGQTASFSRVWSNTLAFYRNRAVQTANGNSITFGLTGQFGDRVAGQWEDRNIGLRGGQRVRVGESVKELLTATDLAFLITGAS